MIHGQAILGLLPVGHLTVLTFKIAEVGRFHVYHEGQPQGPEESQFKGSEGQE